MKFTAAFLLGLIAFSTTTHASIILYCEPTNGYSNDTLYYPEANTHILLKEKVSLDCSSHRLKDIDVSSEYDSGIDLDFDNDYFKVDIEGMGLGLRYTGLEGIMISCPTIKRDAMGVKEYTNKKGEVKEGTTVLKGLKASASVMFGADVGAFVSKKGGTCLLTGFNNMSIGVGVSGAKMTVKTRSRW